MAATKIDQCWQLILIYLRAKGKLKSGVVVDLSAEIRSVVTWASPLCPPNNKTSPDGRSQQRWFSLPSVKVTGKVVNVPPTSSREQVFGDDFPPQTMFPHTDRSLSATGRSATLQLRPDFGSKISAVFDSPNLAVYPPTIRRPEFEIFNDFQNEKHQTC